MRCGLCRQTFRLPREVPVPEDTIFGWLHHTEDDEDERAGTLVPLSDEDARRAKEAKRNKIRLVSLERRGAIFEFPAEFLQKSKFRCAIPRVCIHCLSRVHLSAHLIIFAPQLRDSISLEAEHQAGKLTIPQERLIGLDGEELLQHLPVIPNVPAPANLPMPYWVCDLCSGAGAISGQIKVDQASGHGYCRLFIRNLRLAASFLAAVTGTHNNDFARFVEFAKQARANRWDATPNVIRHRLEQWFKPSDDERFLAYIPDRNRARTEDGMAGVIISTERLIYRRPPVHQELSHNKPITFQIRTSRGKQIATISADGFKDRPIMLDREGEGALRKALSEGNFKVIWR
ncbi:MAG: hypothetical protein SVV80_12630 [Planctomycetota bacterium]|nr:hypothetical protein [Planctomycetota bacterium]